MKGAFDEQQDDTKEEITNANTFFQSLLSIHIFIVSFSTKYVNNFVNTFCQLDNQPSIILILF